jgi:integrase
MSKKKKPQEPAKDKNYCIDAVCHVCSKEFKARYNMVGRAKVCTPPSHKCERKTIKVPGRRDKLISCVEGCCKSKYYKGTAGAAANTTLDSRKSLSDEEFEKVVKASFKLDQPFAIGLRFTLETGCRCGETLLVRKRHLELTNGFLDKKTGKWVGPLLSIVRIPTLKKAGHPVLPVHIDNKGELVGELREWSKKLKPDDFLFPMAKRTFQRVFERILDRVKPERASLVHILRHTRASRLVRSGLDPNTIREEMRWASIELLKVYSHTTEDEVSTAFGKIRK